MAWLLLIIRLGSIGNKASTLDLNKDWFDASYLLGIAYPKPYLNLKGG